MSQVSHHHVDQNKNQEKLFLIVECLKSFSLRWRERNAEMQDLLLSSSIWHGNKVICWSSMARKKIEKKGL